MRKANTPYTSLHRTGRATTARWASLITLIVGSSSCTVQSDADAPHCEHDGGDDSTPVPPAQVDASAQADAAAPGDTVREVLPEYDDNGALMRIAEEDWRSWVFLGSGLNLSYMAGQAPGVDIFTTVYMEPTAYAYYREHGEFREGTMTALAIYLAGDSEPPLQEGLFADQALGFEMSVKDSERLPGEVWGYYNFRGNADRADPQPQAMCNQCHADNAQTDFVFTQFYSTLP